MIYIRKFVTLMESRVRYFRKVRNLFLNPSIESQKVFVTGHGRIFVILYRRFGTGTKIWLPAVQMVLGL
jgi:hypothetical protein